MAGEGSQVGQILARIPLFASVPPEKLAHLAGAVIPRRCQAGERVVKAGDVGDSFFYILAGKVKVTRRLRSGEESMISVLGAGEFFGEQALLDGGPRSASIYAIDAAVLLVLMRDDFMRFLQADPSVALAIIVGLSGRIRQLNAKLEEAYFMELPERLARRLTELAGQHGVTTGYGVQISGALSLSELARSVGASKEQVTQLLGTWQNRGLVRLGWDEQIVILAPAELEALRS